MRRRRVDTNLVFESEVLAFQCSFSLRIRPREFARARPDGAMITVRGRRNAASFLGLIQRRWGSLKYEYLYFNFTHCLCRRRHFEGVGGGEEEGMS
jgi:hypothetical protein